MLQGTPSRTALRVALRRAAHQLTDDPIVFADPFAIPILGEAAAQLRSPQRPSSTTLRAFLVARSRYAEDTLAHAVHHGTDQYVLLGAGLDTFSLRNPYPNLRVFEVDHPDTQQWKQSLLHQQRLTLRPGTSFVPVNFEEQSLRAQLIHAGFTFAKPAVFAWLGVVPYLTPQAFHATLTTIASAAIGTTLIFDYSLPRSALPFLEKLAFDSLAARVAAAGEPFQLFFMPDDLHQQLQSIGFSAIEDIEKDTINQRYFQHRNDHLRILSTAAHLLSARTA